MAKRSLVRYVCANCGAVYAAWTGRCSECGEWNTVHEETGIAHLPTGGNLGRQLIPVSIADSVTRDQTRLISGIEEVDTVLGGGVVAGSVVLLAGQPGIGK